MVANFVSLVDYSSYSDAIDMQLYKIEPYITSEYTLGFVTLSLWLWSRESLRSDFFDQDAKVVYSHSS